ncbi:MAG: GntR family transcriptional regulator [Janthinobacterium lividum]
MDLALDPDNRETLARQVTRELRAAIVTMRIAPGEMLSEQEIATHLGISRAPVREALVRLQDAALIRVLPQRGTLVRRISQQGVEDARFARAALECAVAQEAARRADAAALDALHANLALQRRSRKADPAAAFFVLDDAFHQLLASAANRMSTWAVIEELKPQMDRVRYLSMAEPVPRATIIEQHMAILAAVVRRDPVAAAIAMETHMSAIIHSLPRLAARHPALFETAAVSIG